MALETQDPFNLILALYSGITRTFKPLSFPELADIYKTGGFTYSVRNPIDKLDCIPEEVDNDQHPKRGLFKTFGRPANKSAFSSSSSTRRSCARRCLKSRK